MRTKTLLVIWLLALAFVIPILGQQAAEWNNKSVALGALGKHDEAIKIFKEAIKLIPQYVHRYYH